MYREDMSPSSEDGTSTAGGVRAVPKTADMCRSKVRKGVKVLECTGCGYTSDRRANVTRHYRRIHLQREKLRKCTLCDEVLQTKGAFYQHFLEYHPERGPSYTATHKYKIKAKSKLKSVSRLRRKAEYKSEPFSAKTTRSSIRLRSKKILSDKSNDSSMISCNSSEEAPSISSVEPRSSSSSSVVTSEAPSSFSYTSTDEVASMTRTDTKSFSSSYTSDHYSPSKNADQSFEDDHPNDENSSFLNCAHLPIKKRYLTERRLTERRVLADITNNNMEVRKIEQSNKDKVQILFHEFDLAKLNEKFRAYISEINFDELKMLQ